MKLKKGDRVKVIAGKDLGKDGVIMRVLPDKDKVIVEGVNIAKKHQRPTRATMQGGIIDKDMPIHVSNVALICGSLRGDPPRLPLRRLRQEDPDLPQVPGGRLMAASRPTPRPSKPRPSPACGPATTMRSRRG